MKNTGETAPLYRGQVRYGEEAISAFCGAQFTAFRKRLQLLVVSAGILMIAAALFAGLGGVLSSVLALLGCWLPMLLSSVPKSNADRILSAFDGKFPLSEYRFDRDGFDISSGKDANRIGFDNLIRLIENDRYLFLFASPGVAYMVEKSSLKPHNVEGFKGLVSKKCGLEWTDDRKWYALRPSALRKERRNTRKIPKA